MAKTKNKMKEKENGVNLSVRKKEIQEAIAEQEKERVDRCVERINQALQEENCDLVGTPGLVPHGNGEWVIKTKVQIVTKEQ